MGTPLARTYSPYRIPPLARSRAAQIGMYSDVNARVAVVLRETGVARVMAATLRRNGRTLSRVAIGDDGGGRWELILVAAGGAVAAAIAVLKALHRAGGVAFTVMGVVAALLALGLALQTKVLASQPRRRQVWIVGSAVAFAAGLVIVGLVTFDEPAKSESVNPRFLAGLVESGPFVKDLQPPLEFVGLAPANIGDVSAAQKLTAVQVELAESEGPTSG
jgi:hypothetical protein